MFVALLQGIQQLTFFGTKCTRPARTIGTGAAAMSPSLAFRFSPWTLRSPTLASWPKPARRKRFTCWRTGTTKASPTFFARVRNDSTCRRASTSSWKWSSAFSSFSSRRGNRGRRWFIHLKTQWNWFGTTGVVWNYVCENSVRFFSTASGSF